MNYVTSLSLTLPELILSIGSLALLMVAAYAGDRATRVINWLAVLLFAGAAAALLGPAGNGGDAFGGLYRADAFAAFAKLLIYIAAAVSIIMSPDFFARDVLGGRSGQLRAEYPILILLSGVGMGMMVSAIDTLTLYVGLELLSLASYVLASFMRRDARSAEAGLKYFVLGSLASGILLYGISLLYGFTATTSFDGIAASIAAQSAAGGISGGVIFGLVFVLAGLAFKISAVPFHMWAPDVYEGSPTPVTGFFATAPKVAAMALFVRVSLEALGPATDAWRQIIVFVALASILLGAFGAIGQANIKRLLAYSSINNVGFALVGLAAGTPEGAAATMTYMAIYVAMTLGSFLVVLQMGDAEGRPIETIASLSGLSQSRPGLALALAIFMFSLAGIPPLLGFYAKFVVFDAAVAAGYWPLAAIGIAASVIGAFYYLKVVKTMYFDDAAAPYAASESKIEYALLAICALIVSPLGYFLIPTLGGVSQLAAKALF